MARLASFARVALIVILGAATTTAAVAQAQPSTPALSADEFQERDRDFTRRIRAFGLTLVPLAAFIGSYIYVLRQPRPDTVEAGLEGGVKTFLGWFIVTAVVCLVGITTAGSRRRRLRRSGFMDAASVPLGVRF